MLLKQKKRRVLERYSEREQQSSDRWSELRKNEYNKTYYTKAKTLRNEMVNRIPPEKLGTTHYTLIYENLAGPSPIRTIASDLESLSILLPN